MKKIKLSFMLLTTGLIAACSSSPEVNKEETPQTVKTNWCTFDDGVTAAPDFFCTGAIDDYVVTGRGSSPKSDAGMNFMVQQAALIARVELAQNVRIQISNMVKNYLGTTGISDQETIDKAASSTSESITDESLMGSRIIRRIVGPAGEVYVWVAIDENNLVATSQSAIKTSMANDAAIWQQFQAQKSHDEMAAKILAQRKTLAE